MMCTPLLKRQSQVDPWGWLASQSGQQTPGQWNPVSVKQNGQLPRNNTKKLFSRLYIQVRTHVPIMCTHKHVYTHIHSPMHAHTHVHTHKLMKEST